MDNNSAQKSTISRYSSLGMAVILIILSAGIIFFQIAYAPRAKEAQAPVQNPAEEISDETTERGIIIEEENKTTPENESEGVATSLPYQLSKGEISRGNPNKKQIIFTFDCGAGTHSAQKILEVAKKHDVKLTFFVTGKFAEKNPDLIRQIIVEGHEVFNHTYSHLHLPQITDEQIREEINKAEVIISSLTGTTTKPYFRAPYKERDVRVLNIINELGYQSVIWSVDALDWMPDKTTEQVKQQIYSHIQSGAIILMHVGDDITGNILDEVFTYIEKQEYKIVSLREGLR